MYTSHIVMLMDREVDETGVRPHFNKLSFIKQLVAVNGEVVRGSVLRGIKL